MVRGVLLFGFGLALISACSTEGQYCDKMQELYGDQHDEETCEYETLPELVERCKDAEAYMTCVIDDASDRGGEKTCYQEHCKP